MITLIALKSVPPLDSTLFDVLRVSSIVLLRWRKSAVLSSPSLMDSGESDSSSHRSSLLSWQEALFGGASDFCEIRPWGGIPKFSPSCSDVSPRLEPLLDADHIDAVRQETFLTPARTNQSTSSLIQRLLHFFVVAASVSDRQKCRSKDRRRDSKLCLLQGIVMQVA